MPAISHGASALYVEGHRSQAARLVERKRGDELAGIAFRIPRPIPVGPHAPRLRILVVDDAVHHARGEQKPFDLVAAKGASRISRPAIDMKCIAGDGDTGRMRA